jgi:PAS domain S-box-containing protein
MRTRPDVTGEGLLQLERAYHASLLEHVDDAVVGTDPDFRVTVWNRGAERLYGFTAKEVLGRPARVVASYAGDRSRLELERELLETARARTQITAHRKDGTPVDVELSSVAVRDPGGAVTGYLGIHRDMTEQKRTAEERGRRAHQQSLVAELGLRTLAGGALQAVLDEAVTAAADGLQATLVAIAEVLPGGEALVLRAGVGWRRGAVGTATSSVGRRSLVGYTVMTGKSVVSEDVEADPRFEPSPFLRAYAPASAATVVIAGRRGPFGAFGAFSATRRSFSADDVNFLQSVANVVSAAVERAEFEDLIVDVREAERRRMARDLHDEALRDLTNALAHAGAVGTSAGAADAVEQLARLVPALKRAGDQVRAAIYDLRLDTRATRPIRELLEELVKVERELARDVRIELDVDPGVPAGPLGGVGTHLLRATGEAVVNARRHAGARTIRIAVSYADDELRVVISDDGHGFEVGAEPRTGASGIRGMRERAELVRGELEIESSHAGTTVRFSVPLGADAPAPARKARVLLVEDHTAVREAIAAMFDRTSGFEVVGQASSLGEARAMLGDVDVAVVDLGLPDGFGGDLIKELRDVNPQAQALVLSARLDRREMARAIESGAAATLDKTASLDEVVEAVRRLRAGETLVPLEEVVDLLRLAARERDREREDRQAVESLSPREREVLQLLAEGLGSSEIAERLCISLRAVVFGVRHGIVKVR